VQLKIIFVLFVLFPNIVSAQYDSAHIAPFKQDFSVGASAYFQFTMLTHTDDNNRSTTYIPNTPVGLGLSVSTKRFSVSGGIMSNLLRNPEFGETKITDWQFHYYGRKFIADMFFKNYEGFYSREGEETIVLHPDVKLHQYSVSGQYIFNHKKFSYRAAFNQSEQQLKSAGSFQLGGGFYYNDVSADTSFTINKQNRLSSYQLCVSGGYVYNFIIEKNYHVALGMSAGLNFGSEHLNMKKIKISPNVFPRASVGYNADGWSVGLSFVLNRTYISKNIFFDIGYAEMCFIKRFDKSPKFLR
jgi:hypothetical protein